jgi:hypothetical protein
MNMKNINKTSFILYLLIFIGVFRMIYSIHKYGFIRHLERRSERRKKRWDSVISIE